MNARDNSSSLLTISKLVYACSQAIVSYLAQTWADSCPAFPFPAETCPQSSPVRVASYIGHSAGEIYELAEAANKVDGNKGILGRNHTPEEGSALSWGTAPSSTAARRQPRTPDIWPRQQSQQDEGGLEKSPRVVGVKEKMTMFG